MQTTDNTVRKFFGRDFLLVMYPRDHRAFDLLNLSGLSTEYIIKALFFQILFKSQSYLIVQRLINRYHTKLDITKWSVQPVDDLFHQPDATPTHNVFDVYRYSIVFYFLPLGLKVLV